MLTDWMPANPARFWPVLAVRLILLILLMKYAVFLELPRGDGANFADVTVAQGSTLTKIARELEKSGIIRSSTLFVLISRLRGFESRIQAGEYRFNDGMKPGDIMRKLVLGEVDYRRFTLPEGYSIYQAAELLEQKGFFPADEFVRRCFDPELLTRLGIQGASAEGYLYPATYNLGAKTTIDELIDQMVAQFNKNTSALTANLPSGLNRHEIVTLASIIEKEAADESEKPLISSVFHNRLRLGMPLQSDPTSVYGVRAFAGKVRKADIERKSPYNTYLIKGLPPGPIGNPGIEAIKAAVMPASSDYLYFVAKGKGSHHFSRDLKEHNRAVVRYLR